MLLKCIFLCIYRCIKISLNYAWERTREKEKEWEGRRDSDACICWGRVANRLLFQRTILYSALFVLVLYWVGHWPICSLIGNSFPYCRGRPNLVNFLPHIYNELRVSGFLNGKIIYFLLAECKSQRAKL